MKTAFSYRIARALLVASWLGGAAASAEGVRIVDSHGERNFRDVQAAVDAAHDGDVLLVAPGLYPAFELVGKRLAIVGAFPGTVKLYGTVTIRGCDAGPVVLVGLEVVDGTPALAIEDCSAPVWLQDCSLVAYRGVYHGAKGYTAAEIEDVSAALLVRCTFVGSDAMYLDFGPNGGHGLQIERSRLAVYQCQFLGGDGGAGCSLPGDGGDGLTATDCWVLAAGSAFDGGAEGDVKGSCMPIWWPSPGDDAALSGTSVAHVLDSVGTFVGGSTVPLAGELRTFTVAAIASDAAPLAATVSGVGADQFFRAVGLVPEFEYVPAWRGVDVVGHRLAGELAPLGVVPPEGELQLSLPAPVLPDGVARLLVHQQGRVVAQDSEGYLGTPLVTLFLNRDSPPDCNANGVQDVLEVLEGAADWNHDLIPDDCEPPPPPPGSQVCLWGANPFELYQVPTWDPGLACVEVAAGGNYSWMFGPLAHFIARLSDGSIVEWGDLQYGLAAAPRETGLAYVEIDAGAAHHVGRLEDGSVLAWGSNWHGQCDVPPLPAGLSYVGVSAGTNHTVARRSDGSVVAWGSNIYGQCDVPPLPPGRVVVEVAAGGAHSLARLDDGSVLAWGSNEYGVCDVPPLPSGLTYVELDGGESHNVARRSDGSVVAWGANWDGQCDVPPLPPGVWYVEVSAGSYHSLARKSDGSVVAWGSNEDGQCDVPSLPSGWSYFEIEAGYLQSLARF